MDKIDIAGLQVDAISKADLLGRIKARAAANQKTFVTTLYSEFLFAAVRDRKVLDMLNQADLATADGIAMLWAAKFLSLPLTAKSYYGKILQTIWQAKYSLTAILFRPSWIRSILPEKISGSELVWDLAKLAEENNWSIYLLGGFGDTAKLAVDKLISESANKLNIAGWSSKNPGDPTIIEDIKNAKPDFLFVAYGPLRQEKWIIENLQKLDVKLAIGLGGTFDYLAGRRLSPPKFLRKAGLEWAFRLLTQPFRAKRIFNATFGLVWSLIKYKVFVSLPFRKNVVSVVLNGKNQIFIARFNPEKQVVKALGYSKKKFQNYWQLPQGGIEEHENIETGARRELAEETSIRNAELFKISDHTHSYLWHDIAARPLLVKKRYQFKGQMQHVVYFRFTGQDNEIALDKDELVEYKWMPLENLGKEINAEKIPLVKIIQTDLAQSQTLIKPA